MSAKSSLVEFTDDGAWCWFQDPRALRHVGEHDRTYTGWVTRGGDIEIAAFDHATDAIDRVVLHAEFEPDDHDDPTFYIDTDGQLLVFYTGHGGPEICYRRTQEPEDLSTFGPEESIQPSEAHTYPDPRLIDDTLYLFYRNIDGSVAYVESEDEGDSWSDERELVTTDGRDWCVYRKISDVHDGGVELGMTFAEGGGHQPHRSIRHARFDGDHLETADGSLIATEFPATFWETSSIYDSDATGHDAWIWDCGVAGGIPAVVYAELRAEDDHHYRYASWSDGEWEDCPLADAGSHIVHDNPETYYSGGAVLDHELPGVCYYSTGDHSGSSLVRAERDGTPWDETTVADDEVQNVRPVVPRNRHDELPVLWMRGAYTHWLEDYDTGIVGTRRI